MMLLCLFRITFGPFNCPNLSVYQSQQSLSDNRFNWTSNQIFFGYLQTRGQSCSSLKQFIFNHTKLKSKEKMTSLSYIFSRLIFYLLSPHIQNEILRSYLPQNDGNRNMSSVFCLPSQISHLKSVSLPHCIAR